MLRTPQVSLGSTADSDLAVDRADVGLDGIRAEICQRGDLGVALALRDERQDLRLSIAEPFARRGQSSLAVLRARAGASLMTISSTRTASSAVTNTRLTVSRDCLSSSAVKPRPISSGLAGDHGSVDDVG